MTERSPAAQAVFNAVNDAPHDGHGTVKAAAALRAVAEQVCPDRPTPSNYWGAGFLEGVASVQAGILSIAAELDPQGGEP